MSTAALWFFWNFLSFGLGVVAWRRILPGVRVYGLILISGLYLTGIFAFYGFVNKVPLW